MNGLRVLVVGASSGIGRAFATSAVELGADVAVCARRAERLEEWRAEVGAGHVFAADVTDAGQAAAMVTAAAERMGGLDLVLYAAGTAVLRPLGSAEADDYRLAHEVNVIGPAMVAQAALGVLSPDGLLSFISSESAAEVRWGMAAYASSKAALDTAIRYWRHEHPERRFQRVIMGATMPTGFIDLMGASEHLGTAMERWTSAGIQMTVMETTDVGRHLAEVLAVVLAHPDIDVPDLYLDPRGAAWE